MGIINLDHIASNPLLLAGIGIKLKVFGNGPYPKPSTLFDPPHPPEAGFVVSGGPP